MSAIDPLTAFPSRKDPTFKTRVETFFDSELSTMVDQMNVAIAAINSNDLRGTSSTAFTPNTLGSKTFTTESGKSWVPGMWLTGGYTLDGSEGWAGVVETYSGTTLNVDIKWVSDTATSRSSWQISVSPPVTDLIEESSVIVHSGNGYGSTNTKFRRFTTILENVGPSITYADSAANGASFTINSAGIYAIRYQDKAQDTHAITRNANGAVNPGLTNVSEILAVSSTTGSGIKLVNAVAKLDVSDVLNAHSGAVSTETDASVLFSIRRLK